MLQAQDSTDPMAWDPPFQPPEPTGDTNPLGSPVGTWAPQHPRAERDFKVPNGLLVIKRLCGSGARCLAGEGQLQCPCSRGNSPGATSRGEISVDLGVFSVAVYLGSSLQLEERRGEAEMGAGG